MNNTSLSVEALKNSCGMHFGESPYALQVMREHFSKYKGMWFLDINGGSTHASYVASLAGLKVHFNTTFRYKELLARALLSRLERTLKVRISPRKTVVDERVFRILEDKVDRVVADWVAKRLYAIDSYKPNESSVVSYTIWWVILHSMPFQVYSLSRLPEFVSQILFDAWKVDRCRVPKKESPNALYRQALLNLKKYAIVGQTGVVTRLEPLEILENWGHRDDTILYVDSPEVGPSAFNVLYDDIEEVFNPRRDKIERPELMKVIEHSVKWPFVIFRVRNEEGSPERMAKLAFPYMNDGHLAIETDLGREVKLWMFQKK